jgi:hypothetical protein
MGWNIIGRVPKYSENTHPRAYLPTKTPIWTTLGSCSGHLHGEKLATDFLGYGMSCLWELLEYFSFSIWVLSCIMCLYGSWSVWNPKYRSMIFLTHVARRVCCRAESFGSNDVASRRWEWASAGCYSSSRRECPRWGNFLTEILRIILKC